MVLISTQIEIASSPEHVREVFLDFAKYPEWKPAFIKTIIPALPEKNAIEKGDKLKVTLEGMSFSPIVLENSERQFEWSGSLRPIFVGNHSFRFEPSEKTPGSTTFVQSENFSGILAFLMNTRLGANTGPGFERFNHDLKRRVESLK